MKIGFFLFETFYGKQDIGSSRIRGHWLIKNWKDCDNTGLSDEIANSEAEVYKIGGKYDAIIWQKVYWTEFAKNFKGIQIVDICDADFLHWGYRIVEMMEYCDALSMGTQPLIDFMQNYVDDKPVELIPDRMDIESFGALKKVHTGEAKKAVWFGYSENFPMLDAAITSLIRLKYDELIVVANPKMPYQLPASARGKILLTNIPWGKDTIHADLLQADVVLNPQGAFGKWQYKSENKTLTAWGLGLPVAKTYDDLKLYMDPKVRQAESDKRYQEVREKWDVRQSVRQYKVLLDSILSKRSEKI